MSLPPGKFDSRAVTLSGGTVTVRGLSFEEGRQVKGDDAVYTMIGFGCDMPAASVKEWCRGVPAGDVQALIDAISSLSGLTEDAQFQE